MRHEILSGRVSCPELIGRGAVLDMLRERVDQLEGSGARVVLIAGEAGIGKSRVVAAAQEYAASQGVRVLRSACYPQDRAHLYAPILAILRASFGKQPLGSVAALVAPFRDELAPLLPEWVPHDPSTSRAAIPADDVRRQRFAAFAHCLHLHTGRTPALLVVEDLHWCDDESLEALLFLLREAATPLLIIGTYRDDEITAGLREWQLQLVRTRLATVLQLQPLTPDEVLAMIGAIIGANGETDRACYETIAPLAEGRPFYIEELLQALVGAGDLVPNDSGWSYAPPTKPRLPDSLETLIQQRVALLSREARDLIGRAAVLGRRFDLTLLQELSRRDDQELLGQLKELVAAQLVVEEEPDQFAFRHALTQQAIYNGMLGRERRTLHRAAADAIERLASGAPETQLAALAYHYAQAELWAKALAYAGWAGEEAARLHAPQAAVALFTVALEAAGRLRRPAAGPRGAQVALAPAQLALARGQAYDVLGQFDSALADYHAAFDLAREAGDHEAAWAAHIHLGTLWAGRDYAAAGAHWETALALARAATQPALIAHSLNHVGSWLMNVGRPLEALAQHHEALAIFEQLGDRAGAAQTLDRLGMASFLGADGAASTRYYERATALFEQLDDRYGLATSLVMTMTTRAGTLFDDRVISAPDAFPRSLADGERALAVARELGWRAGEAFALWTLGTLLGHYGRYARALEATRRAQVIAEEIGHQQWQASSSWTLGMIALDLLEPRVAAEQLERALTLGRSIGSAVWALHAASALAVAYLHLHERARAELLLESAVVSSRPTNGSGQVALLWASGNVALDRRDPAAALRLLAKPGLADGTLTVDRDTVRLALLRGEVLIAAGMLDEAEALLVQLRNAARRQEAWAPLWRVHCLLGALWHKTGRFEAAQIEYTAASDLVAALAEELGDTELRAAFLQRATARIPRRYSPASRRARAARFDGLTRREVEVAQLVARGLSNREIAEELVIGERTVETHVSNIFAKLHVATRDEVAAWVMRKGLLP
jgi:DNA-binding CsgD family transcriptional regulator